MDAQKKKDEWPALVTYESFLARKKRSAPAVGFGIPRDTLNPALFPWQRDIVHWALRRGRAGIFPDTGLGKTAMQLTICDHIFHRTGLNCLILAPLAVSRQTLLEARKFNIHSPVKVCSSQLSVESGITITNYEKLHKFDASQFVCVALDEGSILKSVDGKTRDKLLETFIATPYKFVFTATPSPNDIMEIGSYSEFLGVMTRAEMLAMFFTHDGGNTSKWRLKGHAESRFFEWMASWAVMLRKPSDIGHSNEGYNLPPLTIHEHVVESKSLPPGFLFQMEARTLAEQRQARRETIDDRVAVLGELTNRDANEPWITWCNLNEESTTAAKTVKGCVEITGSQADHQKEQSLIEFTDGIKRAIVTKPSIAGFGLNWQHCNKMAFLGLSHSWEQYKQAICRIYRFGQTRPCEVHAIVSDRDSAVIANIQRKQAEAEKLMSGMVTAMGDFTRKEISVATRDEAECKPQIHMEIPAWL